MYSLLRNVFLVQWVFYGAIGSAQTSGHEDTNSASTTTAALVSSTPRRTVRTTDTTGTCPSRTVNYITHTLARQCLRTDRVPYNGTQSSSTNSTAAESPGAEITGHPALPHLPTEVLAQPPSVIEPSTSVASNASPQNLANDQTSSHSTASVVEATPVSSTEEEGDSPLDDASFLSFEDWKRQNLVKAGQSPDDVGHGQAENGHRPRPINNALEGMGEEQEISLDFAGFGGAAQASAPERPSPALTEQVREEAANAQPLRKRDAGKTCKERTNYASFDCAATILKSNKECKSASSVLVENKDSYMLNTCSADNKFFIVELCNDIQIDTVVLANYEFFSSSFRHFKLSVSDRYPVKEEKWRLLGNFEARNTREIQAFLIENPLIWARYLRIEFLSHYGTEYYCPVSLLRVHGTTMMEDYRHQEELARGETDDVEEATLEAEVVATPAIVPGPLESSDEAAKSITQAVTGVEESKPETSSPTSVPQSPPTVTSTKTVIHAETVEASSDTKPASLPLIVFSNGSVPMDVGVYQPPNANMTCETATAAQSPGTSSAVGPNKSGAADEKLSTLVTLGEATDNSTVPESTPSTIPVGSPVSQSSATPDSVSANSERPTLSNSTSTSSVLTQSANATATGTLAGNQTVASTNSTRVASASPPPPQPSSQESFFKSVHKRLLQLESNSTLSLQYIEEQSRILRDAFSKVEKRQVATTGKFLTQLNSTVMAELHGFGQAYDQLWQSTVIELEGHRETYQREMLALSSRLTMVADELIWQKRMSIVQSTLLLLCLALVLFGRQGTGYIEVPIMMQHMMNRSTAALRGGWESPPNSPSPESRSPVSLFRRKIWRSSTEPAETTKYASDGELSRPQTQDGAAAVTPDSHASSPANDGDDDDDDSSLLTPTLTQDTSRSALQVSVEPPSPQPQPTTDNSDWDDRDGNASPELERKPTGGSDGSGIVSAPSSPSRKRKKPKKPPGWPHQHSSGGGAGGGANGPPKNPLATTMS